MLSQCVYDVRVFGDGVVSWSESCVSILSDDRRSPFARRAVLFVWPRQNGPRGVRGGITWWLILGCHGSL